MITIKTTTTEDEQLKKFIKTGLRAYNDQFTEHIKKVRGGKNTLHVALVKKNDKGQIVGALMGRIYWNWLSIDDLFINEAYRKQGIGSQLIQAVEKVALKKGCKQALVRTMSFQARPFYEKNGFKVTGVLEDYPPGHTLYAMVKILIEHQNLSNLLATLKEEDQLCYRQLRELLEEKPQRQEKIAEARQRIKEVLEHNVAKVRKLFTQHGYLGYRQVGKQGAADFWLLVQHCDGDPDFQAEVLKAMKTAVEEDNVDPENFAYLTDRVLVNQGKLQKYGTQMEMNEDQTCYIPRPYTDPDRINERRATLHLMPMELYTQRHNALFANDLRDSLP